MPVSIKDLEPVAGVRFTRGSSPPTRSRPRTGSASSACAGGSRHPRKTNTAEFGFGTTSENRIFGATRNPWNLALTPGGSSSGAAASVACGLTPIAQGSDGGGSVRAPAAFCHVHRAKPTQGLVPRRLRGDQSWNVVATSTLGPMTRTVRDAAVMLGCMAGEAPRTEYVTRRGAVPDFEAELRHDPSSLRIGLAADCGGGVDAQIAGAIRETARIFEGLGAKVEEVEFRPDPPDAIFATFFDYFSARAYQSHGRFLDQARSAALLTDYVHACLTRGKAQSAARHIECLNRMGYYRHYCGEFFERFDLLLTAVTTVPPFRLGELPGEGAASDSASDEQRWGFFRTHLFNLTGNPAASLPAGFTGDGRPLAAQLVGGMGADATVLAASAAFEQARPWRQYWPRLASS